MSPFPPIPTDALHRSPLAIGGVGGSGTRVVAAAAIELGVCLGYDLNPPLDNLAFTLLFKHQQAPDLAAPAFAQRTRLFAAAMTGTRSLEAEEMALLAELASAERPLPGPVQHSVEWLAERAERLIQGPDMTLASRTARSHLPCAGRWGWKEPNTHVLLPQLLREWPTLHYVHVVRNGLDMALSRNQNQLRFWGERWLGRPPQPGPRDSLAYWCVVHRRVQRIGADMGPRFLWLDYDALCADPASGLAQLAGFLGAPAGAVPALLPLVSPQPTSGRHRDMPLAQFDPADLDYLRSIGHLHA